MRAALDLYDDMPKAMRKYLMHNGWHFNKSLCNFAVSLMKKHGKRLDPISKENVDKLLEQHKVQSDLLKCHPLCIRYLRIALGNSSYISKAALMINNNVRGIYLHPSVLYL